ncbi:nucleoside triphosphate pyrophosphohydrolase [Candidatus Fokinia crypta]|uniref:MazG nucleotide pyrophosphohydrolase domain protein n=1 Tax=Candidatus Fokinia crypta TaxID=1920990 RepID=A0ABZ0URU7_9RICK|nr:nucleoside triphosphate pyrophosphohydrolase [Candidatus Fokinia cryptica]WPX97981.1 MazG nucleotide pyrophosphohydrolase domain protein [Candidatus Fokinia cryptica]
MSKYKRFALNKLIRSKLNADSDLIKYGCKLEFVVLDENEYENSLKAKLMEEAQEVIDSKDKDELIEEMGDLLEVISAISSFYNISLDEVEKRKEEKKAKKGGFEERIFAKHLDIPSDCSKISYYKERPTKYPEIELL